VSLQRLQWPADVASRAVRKFSTKDATVAKLFAKHIKLKDSIRFLNSTRTGIAVGTPTRLKGLMDNGWTPRTLQGFKY
jgi:protein CMS1